MNSYVLASYEGPDGGMNPIWEINHTVHEELIRQMGLKRVPRERFLASDDEVRIRRGPGIPGGWPVPHLHFDGDVYLMDQKQWEVYSQGRLRDFSHQLEQASSISFRDFMEVSNAVHAALPVPTPEAVSV